jgi:hypothetical protein
MTAMWARAGSVVVGLWLMAAPAVLGYEGLARDVDRIIGPIAASAAIVAMSAVVRGVRRLEILTGVALLAVPWMLGYPVLPTANSLAAGACLVMLGTVRGRVSGRYGGGWSALFHP